MSSKNTLFEVFQELEDPRRTSGHYLYPLDELLLLTISAVISGVEDWVHIQAFGEDQLEWLRKFLPYAKGIPSHDCLGKVFAHLDHEQFSQAFIQWTEGLSERTAGQVISIDGKRMCGSYDTYKGKAAIHLVSAFASANGLVVGQVKTADKSNEITAIPQLLDLIAVQGCLVTIDAMGCQREIAQKIVDQQADYVLALKANQEELYQEVMHAFTFMPLSATDEQLDKGHGRVERRSCQVISDLRFIDEHIKWPGIKAVARVRAQRYQTLHDKSEVEYRYYICSISDALQINRAVRLHWSIENKLHWVLDVEFGEDLSRKRAGQMPQNFAIITKMAINLIKMNKRKGSIKVKRHKAAWNQTFRQEVLNI